MLQNREDTTFKSGVLLRSSSSYKKLFDKTANQYKDAVDTT